MRHMYGRGSAPSPTVTQIRDKCVAVSPPSLTVIQRRDKCIALSPLTPYCHTNKGQMHSSHAVHSSLTVIQIRDKCIAVSPPRLTVKQIRDKCIAVSPLKPYCDTNKRQM